MRSVDQIKHALYTAQMAVHKLAKNGYQVTNVSLGNTRPVISIERPRKFPEGATVICVRGSRGITENIYAALYNECLITWAADVLEIPA
ncbi:hypothetical protein [Rheinheimera maricola]|uniref:Uncharacterized protein n=1 Tax=Rheinheimera maricola TaxID=2793282 RepID=A0ABS7X631_9GAMM|nr:hypothetical protein [Rheinheimera maricola]MBZ9610776.1 hypothetical protein [Rheinheimera maricola]